MTPLLTVSIDTEEDDWGRYEERLPGTRNIASLPELQDIFDGHGARPTYLINHPPLVSAPAISVLGRLAERSDVEIAAHCHPWNTPPIDPDTAEISMMMALPTDTNRAKIREVSRRIETELGVRPRTFRCGRWALGPTVAQALYEEGFSVDCSVTPLIDWSGSGGPDFTNAPLGPYRFDPADPLTPRGDGSLTEVPATAGFLRGGQKARASVMRVLRRQPMRRLGVVGALDRLGILQRRWLSPEESSAEDMIRLVDALVSAETQVLGISFHSATLLPGATPYVRSEDDRRSFFHRLDATLRHCAETGLEFRTIGEAAAHAT